MGDADGVELRNANAAEDDIVLLKLAAGHFGQGTDKAAAPATRTCAEGLRG